MSNTASKDVELRIRARDYSQKTLSQLTKTLSNLIKVQEAQADAAELGEGKARDLEKTYGRLEDAIKQLLKIDSLTKLFEKQTAALSESTKKVEEARARQAQLAAEIAQTEKVTKKQEKTLKSATTAVAAAERQEAARQASLARTRQELARYGVDAATAAGSQKHLAEQVNRANEALKRQDAAIEKLPMAAEQNRIRQLAEAQRVGAQNLADKEIAAAQARAAAERKAAQQIIEALQRQADQAVATSKGYQTLGRVTRNAAADQNVLGQNLFAIISPAAAARQTLAGTERQVKELSDEITKAGKNIQGGATKLRELAAAQKALLTTGQGIDTFRSQVASVRAAREEYLRAKQDLQTLAAATRQAGVDASTMGNRIKEAQQKVEQSATALRRASEAARATQATLRQAGVDTARLATEETRLVSSANQATSAAQRLTAALRQQNQEGKKTADIFSMIAGNGRQSLSVLERMRGEVMALVTAYAGVMSMVNLAGGAVDAYKTRQQALIKISTVVGSSESALAAEWEYMVGLSNKLGINLNDLATAYTKFAVAANAVGIDLNETRFIFENIAKAGRVFALSADDMNGVFRALEQMLSKGQVYAEELRGQLGERLPGAVAMFAKGMNMTVTELTKRLELGQVKAEEVINFAREQGKAIDAQLAASSTSVGAVEARLQNAMFMFKLAIADSGFIDAYSRALVKLTEFLNSDDGKKAAVAFSDGFSALADALIWCVDNVDLLKEAFAALLALKIASVVVGIGIKIGTLVGGIAELVTLLGTGYTKLMVFADGLAVAGGAAGAAGLGLKTLARWIPYVGGLLIAWDIGKIMYDQSETFRHAVDAAGLYLKGFGNLVVTLIGSIFTGLDDLTRLLFTTIKSMGAEAAKAVGESVAGILRMIPKVGEGLAQTVDEWTNSMDLPEEEFVSKTKEMWDQLGKDWKAMQEGMTEKHRQEADTRARQEYAAAMKQAQAGAMPGEGFEYTPDPGTGATARDREIARLTTEFNKLTTAAEKADMASKKALMRKNLPGRLALVDEQFADQMKAAKAIGGPEGAKLVAQLQKIIDMRKQAERQSFEAQGQGAAKSALERRARQVEALRQEYEKLAAEVGNQAAKVDPTVPFADRLAAALKKVEVQYDALIAKAQKLGGTEGPALAAKFEELRKANMELVTQKNRMAELERLEAAVNSQINIKRAALEEINALREAGAISEDEQVRRTVELYNQQNGAIEQAIANLEAYAATMKSSMTPEQWALINAEIAKMRAGLSSVVGTYKQMDTLIVNGVLDGMISGLDAVAQGIAGAIDGTMSMSEAWSNLGDVMRQFFADFLMQIAKAILQQMILNALAGFGGSIGSAAGAAGGVASASVLHSGGTVGSKTGSGGSRSRSVPANWFAAAPRFHDGGLPGLKRDEVPTVLQKGEEVLSKGDPRNVLNGGAAAGQGGPVDNSVRNYNMIDTDSLAQAVMSNPGTGRQIINIIKAQKREIKTILG